MSQELNVKEEKYPGIKKVIVKSTEGDGYWGEYILDKNGQPKVEKRFKKKVHLATSEYIFLDNGLLSRETVSFDINNPKRVQVFNYSYDLTDNQIYAETCYTDRDTLSRVDNLEFNDKGQRIVYTRNKNESKNFLTYENGLVKTWRSINLADSSERIYEFGYDLNGNLISFDLKQIPETALKIGWLDVRGDGNHRRYTYKYDKYRRWTKKYQIIGRRKILLEKRVYEM